jgi:hypothetical protein
MVLSGLSVHSNGDGGSMRTVNHILLQSDLARWTLKRRKGDFLWTSNRGKLGSVALTLLVAVRPLHGLHQAAITMSNSLFTKQHLVFDMRITSNPFIVAAAVFIV